uniref:Uncharacterized protein n=1 Tax=Salix viminalis TaxID=40686 RepID=A0A6N2KGH0_SALVM
MINLLPNFAILSEINGKFVLGPYQCKVLDSYKPSIPFPSYWQEENFHELSLKQSLNFFLGCSTRNHRQLSI